MSKPETYNLIAKVGDERFAPHLDKMFDFELPHQCERLANSFHKLRGKAFKLHIKESIRPKSLEALGFLYGGIYRAMVMESKGLMFDPEKIPENWTEYRRKGFVKSSDVDEIDTMLRLEFHYEHVKTLKGELTRVPKDLSSRGNKELLEYIDKIMEWRGENGYKYLDIEKYKQNRDAGRLKRGYEQKDIVYPVSTGEVKF